MEVVIEGHEEEPVEHQILWVYLAYKKSHPRDRTSDGRQTVIKIPLVADSRVVGGFAQSFILILNIAWRCVWSERKPAPGSWGLLMGV